MGPVNNILWTHTSITSPPPTPTIAVVLMCETRATITLSNSFSSSLKETHQETRPQTGSHVLQVDPAGGSLSCMMKLIIMALTNDADVASALVAIATVRKDTAAAWLRIILYST